MQIVRWIVDGRPFNTELNNSAYKRPQSPHRMVSLQNPNGSRRVGVWLMPDNQNDGKLEHFLQSLIADNDQLINHARASTNSARDIHGASFSDGDSIKAEIHTWLAWQQERRKRTKRGRSSFLEP